MIGLAKLPMIGLAAVSLASGAACAAPAEIKSARHLITDYDPDVHGEINPGAARYQIVIHSGAGIPGTPGADDFYRKPKQVLQAIVDQCKLGPTIYLVATDGVSLLSIADDKLKDEQTACIRSAEGPGLYLQDRGSDG